MKSSKARASPEVQPARRWPRLAALIALSAAIACGLVWFLTREDPRALAKRGEALLASDPAQAGELLGRAVAAAGGDYPEAQLLLCEAMARQSRWLEAFGCLSLIKDKSKCDGDRLLTLAREAQSASELMLAEQALAAAKEAGAPEVEILKVSIPLLLAVRGDDDALAACRRLARLTPNDALPMALEARILRARADILAAIEAYRGALARMENSGEAATLRSELLELLIQMKDGASARHELDLLPPDAAPGTAYPLLCGHVLRLEGRLDEAIESLEPYLARHSNDANALLLRGTVWFEMERFEKAAEDLSRAVEINPHSKEAHYKLGQCLLRLNRSEQGKEHLQISAKLTAQTQEILTLEREAANDPQNETLRVRLRELYKAVGISRER